MKNKQKFDWTARNWQSVDTVLTASTDCQFLAFQISRPRAIRISSIYIYIERETETEKQREREREREREGGGRARANLYNFSSEPEELGKIYSSFMTHIYRAIQRVGETAGGAVVVYVCHWWRSEKGELGGEGDERRSKGGIILPFSQFSLSDWNHMKLKKETKWK